MFQGGVKSIDNIVNIASASASVVSFFYIFGGESVLKILAIAKGLIQSKEVTQLRDTFAHLKVLKIA